jgi:DNA-3-methyladenine glycosylase
MCSLQIGSMNKTSLHQLPRNFFSRPTRIVAQELLGCLLVRHLNGHRLSGVIVEAEAYIGEEDLACHAKAGRTSRTQVMYGPAGFSYVYFTYGMHWMLNVVTESEEFPAAVLIRAIQPVEGVDVMQRLRGRKEIPDLCSGPAKLTQALDITRAQNGLDLCQLSSQIAIEPHTKFPSGTVSASPRIGLGNTPEPWKSKPWRYAVRDNPFVSK